MFESLLKFLKLFKEKIQDFIVRVIFLFDKSGAPSIPIDIFEPKKEDQSEDQKEKE